MNMNLQSANLRFNAFSTFFIIRCINVGYGKSYSLKKVVNLMDLVIVEIRFLSDQYSNLPLVEYCDKLLF